jgi:hypothetical protein
MYRAKVQTPSGGNLMDHINPQAMDHTTMGGNGDDDDRGKGGRGDDD